MKDKLNPDEMPFFHDKIKGDHGYTVPQGYFETLPDILVERLRDELDTDTNGSAKVLSLWPGRGFVKWAAAAVILLLAGTFVILSKHTSGTAQTLANNDEIVEYLLSEDVDLTDEDLALLPLSNTDLSIEVTEETMNSILDDIGEDELEQIMEESILN